MNSLSSIFDQGLAYGELETPAATDLKWWQWKAKTGQQGTTPRDPLLAPEQKAKGFEVGTDLASQLIAAWGQRSQSIDEKRQPYPVTPPPPAPPDYSGIIIAGIVSALLLGGTFAYISSKKRK